MYEYELYHHGIKGQKWGVRKYQYADGSLTPAGRKRYQGGGGVRETMGMKVKDAVNRGRTVVTGRQYVDGYLAKGTTFARIQVEATGTPQFAFYATYNKKDQDKYMGLYDRSLRRRAKKDAEAAEAKAAETGDAQDIKNAEEKRAYHDNMKVYQVKLETTKKLKIPSDENASDVTASLLKEKDFKENLAASIADAKEKMIRPGQQVLLKQAQNAMSKDPDKLTPSEKVSVYKALNLSLTYHNEQQVATQNRFYDELKKKGYNALLDYNDKDYSSFHAKRPMIVFDTDSVKMQSIAETNPEVVKKLYRKYNAERIRKEVTANTLGYVSKLGTKTVSECDSFVRGKMDEYLQ